MCWFRKYTNDNDIDYTKDSDNDMIPDFMDVNPYCGDADSSEGMGNDDDDDN